MRPFDKTFVELAIFHIESARTNLAFLDDEEKFMIVESEYETLEDVLLGLKAAVKEM